MEGYRFVYEGGIGETVEKKSRFIAEIRPVETPEEAMAFVAEKKKEFWDARHNCYAYVIGDHQEQTRCSDDGEPAGTAGRPMLDVLLREDLHNVAVVVTRYFGGVLLGTGGLVRAYQGAVAEGLKHCRILQGAMGRPLSVTTDYQGYGKVEYVVREQKIPILDTVYGEMVCLELMVPEELTDHLEQEIRDKTSGKAEISWGDETFFAVDSEGKIIFKKST